MEAPRSFAVQGSIVYRIRGRSTNNCPTFLTGHHAERDEYVADATVMSRSMLTHTVPIIYGVSWSSDQWELVFLPPDGTRLTVHPVPCHGIYSRVAGVERSEPPESNNWGFASLNPSHPKPSSYLRQSTGSDPSSSFASVLRGPPQVGGSCPFVDLRDRYEPHASFAILAERLLDEEPGGVVEHAWQKEPCAGQ